jgi:phospholipid/cholesterol/gamma-HCH transport system substrate-binding protein
MSAPNTPLGDPGTSLADRLLAAPRRVRRSGSSKLLVSAAGVFVVFVLCVAYIVSGVLGSPLTSRPKDVRVELTSTGGLFEGSAVTYRGVSVGKITRIGFTADGVEATARLTTSRRIPSDTRAVVRSLSPVGEQYLDLQPRDDDGPWLHDGSRISASATDVPQTLASTVIAVNKLLDQVDADQLHTVLDEASTALRGTGDDLARLTDQGRLIVADLNRYWPQAERVLRNGGTLLDIGVRQGDLVRQSARDFRAFARFLRDYQPELAATLADSDGLVTQIRRVLRDARDVLPLFLARGAELTGLLVSYEPHLRALLAAFAPGLDVLARAVRDDSLQLNVIGQKDHECIYPNTDRDPKSTTRRPLRTDLHCPDSGRYLQRGAAHAPGPVR